MNTLNNGYKRQSTYIAMHCTRFSIVPFDAKWAARISDGTESIIAVDEDRGNLLERCKASVALLQQEGIDANIHVYSPDNKLEATLNFYGVDPNAVEDEA